MKYTDVRVIKSQGYVSSSHDYHVRVFICKNGAGFTWTFLLNARSFIGKGSYIEMPKYVIAEVMRQLREMMTAGTLKWHEYDRDGNERWENLRYYDHEEVLQMISD